MFRPMLMASVLWLAIMVTSCQFMPSSTPAKDTTATTMPRAISFHEFIDGLPVVQLPYYQENLVPVPAGYKVHNIPPFYINQEAGKLLPVNGYTPVIYSAMVQEGIRIIYLITYDADGNERSRLQLRGDGFIDKQSPAYDEHFKDARLYAEIGTDSLIELKCYYEFNDRGNINIEKRACFFYHIAADGMIMPVPGDTISLTDFAAAFPLKEKPWQLDSLQLSGLQLISRLTPYFNFAEVEIDKVYAYGRIELDGLPPVLLFGREETEGEGGTDAQLDLIAYNERGHIAGNLMVLGGSGREGENNTTSHCRIDHDGNVRVEETHLVHMDDGFDFTEKVDMQYAIQSSGSIVPVEATLISITSPLFQQENLIKKFRTSIAARSSQIDTTNYLLSEIPSPERISAHMHFYQRGSECLMELYTTYANGKVIDRYPVYNTLKKVDYKDAAVKDQEAVEDYVIEKRGHYTKDVIFRLPGKDLHINADGRFVK